MFLAEHGPSSTESESAVSIARLFSTSRLCPQCEQIQASLLNVTPPTVKGVKTELKRGLSYDAAPSLVLRAARTAGAIRRRRVAWTDVLGRHKCQSAGCCHPHFQARTGLRSQHLEVLE